MRKQRNDRFDAQHILKLMLEENFPRIWVPTPENRDLRQLCGIGTAWWEVPLPKKGSLNFLIMVEVVGRIDGWVGLKFRP